MRFRDLNARQLIRMIKKGGLKVREAAAQTWANRIESGPGHSCTPKAKLRRAGLLPPVGALEEVPWPKDKNYAGLVMSDGTTCVLLERLCETEFVYQGENLTNFRQNKWWGRPYPAGGDPIVCVPDDTYPGSLKCYRIVCESSLSPAKSS